MAQPNNPYEHFLQMIKAHLKGFLMIIKIGYIAIFIMTHIKITKNVENFQKNQYFSRQASFFMTEIDS